MKRYIFPFSAIVGQDRMKTALLLNAVDPSIGGVLISGHKGTGKSTAVRALASLLPEIDVVEGCPFHCDPKNPSPLHGDCYNRFVKGETLPEKKRPMPLVGLPLGATEDRVAGTLHIEHALKKGERRFEPGLLAAAHRGILYVDEVNLLDDHLVDLLLDAAASGVNVVEREGISHTHPARFMLVGTMNPEEGLLRPQFLDRFGLFVSVKGVEDFRKREEIVRRRLAFERDAEAFWEKWRSAEAKVFQKIRKAKEHLNDVRVTDDMVSLSVHLAAEVEARGHRAEIAIIKVARGRAALSGKTEAGEDAITEAAQFVLPHRIPSTPVGTPEAIKKTLEEALVRVLGKKKAGTG